MGDGTVPRPSATPAEFEDHENEIYGAERHASLQNDDDVLLPAQRDPHAAGRSTRRLPQRADKVGPARSTWSDWATPAEPIAVRAQPLGDPGGAARRERAERRRRGEERRRAALRDASDGWFQAELGPLPEGVYRVTSLGGSVEPVTDSSRSSTEYRWRNWALVIGVDRYWSDGREPARRGARRARDARVAARPGRRQRARRRTCSSCSRRRRAAPRSTRRSSALEATKANIMIAINNLMVLSGGKGERLYFYFAGHGLTARVVEPRRERAARDRLHARQHRPLDRAPVAVGVLRDDAVRATSSSSSTPAATCRVGRRREFEIGRWTLPRSRDPGRRRCSSSSSTRPRRG